MNDPGLEPGGAGLVAVHACPDKNEDGGGFALDLDTERLESPEGGHPEHPEIVRCHVGCVRVPSPPAFPVR